MKKKPDEKRRRYDAVLRRLDKKFARRLKAIRDSERITEEDLAIRINCKQ